VGLFQAALLHCGLRPATVISWLDLLAGRESLCRFARRDAVLRIESPGENFDLERELIALGAGSDDPGSWSRISSKKAQNLSFDRGRILYPGQWFHGFRMALNEIERQLIDVAGSTGRVVPMNHTPDIALMFDKPRCHAWLASHGVLVPRALDVIRSYDHLREEMAVQRCRRVFVKLACGSSSSGVVAYETDGCREQAWSPVELIRGRDEVRLYNSLKVRRYRDRRDIRAIIDSLCVEGVHVEQWVPKASFGGGAADLRVVVIACQPEHVVVRLSESPMTNLHLGNRRGNTEAFLKHIGTKACEEIWRLSSQAARLFSASLYAGLDIGVSPGFRRAVIFEVNAFGDLLPNVLHRGVDTYQAEIFEAVQRWQRTAA
jgi:hypothetical protein